MLPNNSGRLVIDCLLYLGCIKIGLPFILFMQMICDFMSPSTRTPGDKKNCRNVFFFFSLLQLVMWPRKVSEIRNETSIA